MSNRQYIGTVCIRKGTDFQEPRAVYVAGINSFDSLICRVLNTGEVMFSDPDGDTLMSFNFDVLSKLSLEWKLQKAKDNVVKLEQRITDEDY